MCVFSVYCDFYTAVVFVVDFHVQDVCVVRFVSSSCVSCCVGTLLSTVGVVEGPVCEVLVCHKSWGWWLQLLLNDYTCPELFFITEFF